MKTLKDKIENKDFKEFVEAVNKLLSHPKDISDKELNETWEAITKFREYAGKEINDLLDKGQTILEHDPNIQYPYTDILRANPLILFCMNFLSQSLESRKELFCELEQYEPNFKEKLNPLTLFFDVHHTVGPITYGGDETKLAALGFVLYPELKGAPFALLLSLINQYYRFVGVYSYLQRMNARWPEALNDPKLMAEEQLKVEKSQQENLLSDINSKSPEAFVYSPELKKSVQKSFKTEMQKVALFAEFPSSELYMAAHSINFDINAWISNLQSSKVRVLSCLEEKKLILELIKNLKLDSEEFPLGRVHAAKLLHFLLVKGQSLPKTVASEEPWFAMLPWEDFRDYLVFLFENIEKQKEEVVKFLNEKYPNLILHHIMKGHFFIAERLVDLGLVVPKISLSDFLEQSVSKALAGSKEIKKYQAMLLLMQEKGILTRPKVTELLTKLIEHDRTLEIQKLVLDNLKLLLRHYIENEDDQLEVIRDNFKRLSDLMLSFERDYALALSSIYDHPIVQSANTFAFRGLKLSESAINAKLCNSYFAYGHRASFYSFLSHGYNTTVHYSLEKGPQMPWAGGSETIRVSPTQHGSSGYASCSNNAHGILITLQYGAGDPIFFGNIRPRIGEMPGEMEVPICFPNTILKVEITDWDTVTLIDRQGIKPKAPKAFISATHASATKTANDMDNSHFVKSIEETCRNQKSPKEYVESYSVDNLMKRWSHHHSTFSSMAARLRKVQEISGLAPPIIPIVADYLVSGFQINLSPKAVCFDYGSNKPSTNNNNAVVSANKKLLID